MRRKSNTRFTLIFICFTFRVYRRKCLSYTLTLTSQGKQGYIIINSKEVQLVLSFFDILSGLKFNLEMIETNAIVWSTLRDLTVWNPCLCCLLCVAIQRKRGDFRSKEKVKSMQNKCNEGKKKGWERREGSVLGLHSFSLLILKRRRWVNFVLFSQMQQTMLKVFSLVLQGKQDGNAVGVRREETLMTRKGERMSQVFWYSFQSLLQSSFSWTKSTLESWEPELRSVHTNQVLQQRWE